MAKGQQRSNREPKKPKKTVEKPKAKTPSFLSPPPAKSGGPAKKST